MTVDLSHEARATPAQMATKIGQATAVEQARAVAEVQAAVVVAQQVPRDMGVAKAEMLDACGRLGMAQRAFYSVPNRGSGPTVHLARELARIFGNVQYGVHELRRDDEAGESEVQAFAWDVEKNVRSTRTFVVPHARMKTDRQTRKPTREKLVDLGDIYLMNQNVGARAVRECIFTVLPRWYTDLAEETCQGTLRDGEGQPIDDRIAAMVAAFAEMGVSQADLEKRIQKRRSSWGPGEVAQLSIVFTSLRNGESSRAEEFPQQRVTADEIASESAAPRAAGGGKPSTADPSEQDTPPPGGPDDPWAGADADAAAEHEQARS